MYTRNSHSLTSTLDVSSLLSALVLPLALLVAGAMVGCDTTGPQEEEASATLQVEASDSFAQAISEDSSAFAWDVFAQELVVRADLSGGAPDRDAVPVRLAVIKLVGSDSGAPDVVGTATTEPVSVSLDRLSQGVKAGDLYSAPGLRPLVPEEQFPSDAYFPVPSNQFVTGDPVDPVEAPGGVPLYDEALGQELGPDEAAVVVHPFHAFAPGGVPLYDKIRPLGVYMTQAQ
jgi:hypothetical protein